MITTIKELNEIIAPYLQPSKLKGDTFKGGYFEEVSFGGAQKEFNEMSCCTYLLPNHVFMVTKKFATQEMLQEFEQQLVESIMIGLINNPFTDENR